MVFLSRPMRRIGSPALYLARVARPALRLAPLAALWLVAVAVRGQTMPLTLNVASREEVRQFYRGVYPASEDVPMGWTGSYATLNSGDTSAAYKEATRLRVNFFRAMAGVPANIQFNATFSAKDQIGALMLSVNNALSHTPPPTWKDYSATGAEATGSSNIALGNAGPDAITAYIADNGTGNEPVGHRRWIFYPQTLQMGTGDVPGDGTPNAPTANALWILDGLFGTARPPTRTTEVTYPPAGYVPYQLVWPRWSFSYPGADFSAATVTMSRGGQSVATKIEPPGSPGEPTLVWVYDNLDPALATQHPKPASDVTYSVTVGNVLVGGAPKSFTYNVTVFDPDVAGADALPLSISGPASPVTGAVNSYTVARPSFAGGFQWRTLALAPFTKVYNAEAGLDGIIAATSDGYDVVETNHPGAGSASFHLAHPAPLADQTLTLPDTILITSDSAALTFLGELGIATPKEIAHVQVSLDEGVNWIEVYTQAGADQAGAETKFSSHSIPLGAYVGRTLKLRFVYDGQQSYYPYTTSEFGWFIDSITVSGAQGATASPVTTVANSSTLLYTPSATGSVALQARGLLFGAYPIEWGPVSQFLAVDAGAAANPGHLANLSILTTLTSGSDGFTLGYVMGGQGTSGQKQLLIRTAGPALGDLGVGGTAADPKMVLFHADGGQSTQTGANDNWGGSKTISDVMASVGAFPFNDPNSKDAAIVQNVAAGNNSVQVSATGAGLVIAEIYDAGTWSATTPHLINVSVLKQLGSGFTVGFVVGGNTAKKVVIRAVGPTLAATFGLGGTVPDPKLVLFHSVNGQSTQIGENNDWGGGADLKATFAAVGAFSYASNTSKDAALVATLAPGNYSVQVSDAGGADGTTLVEVYEVPDGS